MVTFLCYLVVELSSVSLGLNPSVRNFYYLVPARMPHHRRESYTGRQTQVCMCVCVCN